MKDKKKDKDKAEKTKLDFSDEVKRLNRVIGQIEGIQKMLEAGRKLEDILTQSKAVHSALSSIESRVFKIYLDGALEDLAKSDKKKDRAEIVEELESLFKRAA